MGWVFLTVCGVGCLKLMKRVRKEVTEVALERAAALFFLAAGVAGIGGWLGHMVTTVVGALMRIIDRAGSSITGGSVAWIAVTALAFAWVCALMPHIEGRFSRWLAASGLFIPSVLSIVPGALGEALRGAVSALGSVVASGMSWLVAS